MTTEKDAGNGPDEGRSVLADVAANIVDGAASGLAAARRVIDDRPGARVRRVKAMARRPLANLWDDYPYHRGFAAYRWLCRRLVPPLRIHGHTALSAVSGWRQELGGTTFVNATGAVLVEFAAHPAATISTAPQATGEEQLNAAGRPGGASDALSAAEGELS